MTELILYKNKKIEDKIDYYIQNIDIDINQCKNKKVLYQFFEKAIHDYYIKKNSVLPNFGMRRQASCLIITFDKYIYVNKSVGNFVEIEAYGAGASKWYYYHSFNNGLGLIIESINIKDNYEWRPFENNNIPIGFMIK